MEITYHLTYWETVYFTYYQTFRNRILQVWVAILLLFLGYITFNALRFQHSLLVKILVSAVILFAGLAIFGLLLSLEVLVNCYINRKRIQAACHLSISELGLVIS